MALTVTEGATVTAMYGVLASVWPTTSQITPGAHVPAKANPKPHTGFDGKRNSR